MFTLTVENKYGQRLELTHNEAYAIKSIDGIDPPDAVINTTHNAGEDGTVYNSSYIGERTITITLAINAPAEANRINLYTYFKSKMPVRLYFANGARNVFIDGYVQTVGVAYFDRKQTVQIVIKCPRPLFNAVTDVVAEIASIDALFEFPFSIAEAGIPFSEIVIGGEQDIYNGGDVETGAEFVIQMLGAVVRPQIYNLDTNESMKLSGTFARGDKVTINTIRGQRHITLLRDGVESNIIGQLEQEWTWFTLVPTDNIFTFTADSGAENMLVSVNVADLFEGV